MRGLFGFPAAAVSDTKLALSSNASNWAEQGYMIPHEALRRELFIGQRVLQRSFDGTVEWHVRNFFDWYRFFVQIVHGHHWSEEVCDARTRGRNC